VDVLFILGNLGGAALAAAGGELLHASGHVALVLLGAYVAWRLAPTSYVSSAASGEIAERLTRLQQSVDAVAIEVERIGEGQRFMSRVLTENAAPLASAINSPNTTEKSPV